jgi:MFS family permease
MVLYALSLTAVGRFYDRYGPQWVIGISTVFLAAGYILMAAVNSLWQFYLFYGILAAIGFGGTSVPLAAAVTSKWFTKWRGFAVSLALAGGSLGQFALIPIFTLCTLRYGWRVSYFSIGVIMLVVNIVLTLLVIRGDPDDRGRMLWGHKAEQEINTRDHQTFPHETPGDLGLRQAMHTYSFWLFLIVMFICGSGDFLVTTHLIPLVTDYGISPITAGNMLAWFGLMSLAGILIAGPASDLIGNKIPIALTFFIRIFLFLMILKYQSTTSFYVFALVFGLTHLITAPLTATLIGRMYGLSHIGLLSGFITTVHHLGGGLLAYLGGTIFDKTGSYQLVFVISAFMAFIATVCSMLIAERRHQAS